jgi:UDP-glucose 4-epimerase
MRVLVTGGGGFLGAAAIRALIARGDTAIAFDTRLDSLGQSSSSSPGPHPTLSQRDPISAASPARREEDERLVRVLGDITDMANVAQAVSVHKPDAVLHCAAIVGVLSSLSSPINVLRVNVEGSLNVFEAMRLGGIRRCIHMSSEEAYGPFHAHKIDETHPLDPVLPYGVCKAAVEQLGRGYRALHGLEIINLRTSWVYGPGLPRDRIPKNLVDAALDERKLHIPTGADSAIDHTHVDDVVSAILAALDRARHAYDVYNVASGTATTVAQIISIIRDLVPGAQLSVGPGTYRHGDRVEAVRKGALDVSRAAAELDWRPRYDIRTGLAAYVKAARESRAVANN